jgi:uncharacterized protein (DUF2236 family)
VFLGAGRALLLQLAHPWVATAIEQHSDAFAHPIGRFHRTFSAVYTMVFGTVEQSLSAARRLHARHAVVRGILPSQAGPFPAGSGYCANAVPALRWVYATLVETALLAHSLVLPVLTEQERERYYNESYLFAGLFGINPIHLPRDWTAFSFYIEEMMQSSTLTVTPFARAMAHQLLADAGTWLRVPKSYQALTAALLPLRLREAFELPYGPDEQRAAQRLVRWAGRIYPRLPSKLRYVGPYHEAEQRLAGRHQPTFATRISNRFWIGQSTLPKAAASPNVTKEW